MASQSFLFTAYAITLNGLAVPGGATIVERQAMLCWLIPAIGVATTGLIYTGLIAAWRASAWLRREFHARVPDATPLGLPPIHAPGGLIALGQVAPRVLPLVFLVVWLYLLVAGLR